MRTNAVLGACMVVLVGCGAVVDDAREPAPDAGEVREAAAPDVVTLDASAPDAPIAPDAAADASDAAVDTCAQTFETQVACYGTDTRTWKASRPAACLDIVGCTQADAGAAWCCD